MLCIKHVYFFSWIAEQMTAGTLKKHIKTVKGNKVQINPKIWKRWCQQILSALRYLHNKKLPHGTTFGAAPLLHSCCLDCLHAPETTTTPALSVVLCLPPRTPRCSITTNTTFLSTSTHMCMLSISISMTSITPMCVCVQATSRARLFTFSTRVRSSWDHPK